MKTIPLNTTTQGMFSPGSLGQFIRSEGQQEVSLWTDLWVDKGERRQLHTSDIFVPILRAGKTFSISTSETVQVISHRICEYSLPETKLRNIFVDDIMDDDDGPLRADILEVLTSKGVGFIDLAANSSANIEFATF